MPGGSQGERLGAFSWFVLCRVAKNEHQSRTPNARDEIALCEAGYEVVKTLVITPKSTRKDLLPCHIFPTSKSHNSAR